MFKTALVTLAAVVQIAAAGLIYPVTMEVVGLDYSADLVTLETATGYTYQMTGCEDYTRGDLVALVMWSSYTDTIEDDVIITARFSGWAVREGGGEA